MQSRTFIISHQSRQKAINWLNQVTDGVIVEFRKPKRSLGQNARMWAMLGDIASARPDGKEYTPEIWKCLFMKALGHEIRFVHGLDGEPFPYGFKTSNLNPQQMKALMEYIEWYAAEFKIELQVGSK